MKFKVKNLVERLPKLIRVRTILDTQLLRAIFQLFQEVLSREFTRKKVPHTELLSQFSLFARF